MGKKLSAYNLHMKRTLKGKMKGKTKAQRKAIFKAAARAWKGKSKPRSKPKSAGNPKRTSRRSSTSRRMNTTMGKSTFNMNKIYGLVRKGAFFAPGVLRAIGPGDAKTKGRLIVKDYLGIDYATMQFDLMNLRRGWEPYFWSNVVTRVVPKVISFVTGLLG